MTEEEPKLKAPRGEYLIEGGMERDIVDSINMATKIQRIGRCMGNSWVDDGELVCNGRQKKNGGEGAIDVIALRRYPVGFILSACAKVSATQGCVLLD
jgi:hypothetical protein